MLRNNLPLGVHLSDSLYKEAQERRVEPKGHRQRLNGLAEHFWQDPPKWPGISLLGNPGEPNNAPEGYFPLVVGALDEGEILRSLVKRFFDIAEAKRLARRKMAVPTGAVVMGAGVIAASNADGASWGMSLAITAMGIGTWAWGGAPFREKPFPDIDQLNFSPVILEAQIDQQNSQQISHP